jgi:hypothetical protein
MLVGKPPPFHYFVAGFFVSVRFFGPHFGSVPLSKLSFALSIEESPNVFDVRFGKLGWVVPDDCKLVEPRSFGGGFNDLEDASTFVVEYV